MDGFEPVLNLIATLTVLSVIAERFTNQLKMSNEKLRVRAASGDKERERAYAIHSRSLIVCLVVAVLLKADIFSMLSSMDSPWATLGWISVEGRRWAWTSALAGPSSFAYTIGGCLVTGFALGFGSKFWHDLLGAVYEVRDFARNTNRQRVAAGAKEAPAPAGPGGDQ